MKKFLSILFVFVILAILGAAITGVVVDNITSKNVENELSSIELPDNTTIDSTISRTGKLTVKDGALQFYGAVLLKSSSPYALLQSHYTTEYKGDLEIKLIPLSTAKAEFGEDFDSALRFGHHDGQPEEYYLLYAFTEGQMPFPMLDYRSYFS